MLSRVPLLLTDPTVSVAEVSDGAGIAYRYDALRFFARAGDHFILLPTRFHAGVSRGIMISASRGDVVIEIGSIR